MRIVLLILIVFVMIGTSFGRDSTKNTPTVKTFYPGYITDRRANICASISSNDGSVISRGFAIRKTDSREREGHLEYRDRNVNDHYCIVLRLYPGISYTVRAYICTKNETIYGNPVFFKTMP